jgi:diguanylate cyclase (GGDEF)-like protein/PAS domain S-box-containing protein
MRGLDAEARATPVRALPLGWLLLGGNLLLAGLLVALALLALQASRDTYADLARDASRNIAVNLAGTLGAELSQVDLALQNVRGQLAREHLSPSEQPQPRIERMLAAQLALLPALESLRIADAQGIVRHGNDLSGQARLDLRMREFFHAAREAPGSALVVSDPLQSRVSSHWVVALARRLQADDGSFDGVVYATLSVEHFRSLFARVDVGPEGAIGLRTLDLKLIARHNAAHPDMQQDVGRRVDSPELLAALARQPEHGAFVGSAGVDGIDRSSAYERVRGFPLLVIAGVGTGPFFAPWRALCWQAGGLVALVLALLAGLSLVVWRTAQRARHATRALIAEGRRHGALLRAAGDGIHVLDREGHLLELSDSFAAMLGEPREALLGRHLKSWDADVPPEAVRAWLRNLSEGDSRCIETRHRRADGTLRDVEVQLCANRIEGELLVYCAARDITERKRLQQRLAEHAQQIRELYDQAPCGYHAVDAEGVFVHVNATEAGWLGLTPAALVGLRRITDFMEPLGLAAFHKEMQRLAVDGRIEGVEAELLPAFGPRRRVRIDAVAVRDEQGRLVHTRSVMHDVTLQHRAEQARLQLLREQQAMLDNEMIGMLKLQRRTCTWKNRALDRMFGYAGDELLGQSARALHADDASFEAIGEQAYAALRAGRRFRSQLQMRHRSGRLIWVDANGVALSEDETLWMMVDIGEMKQAHERVEHLAFHDALTGLPNRRLLDDRLQQALSAARRGERMVAVCYLDLDGFKPVNDRHGHEVGDLVLKEVAQRLHAEVRAHDTAARLGGDEFVLVLTQLNDQAHAEAVLQRVVERVADPVPLPGGGSARVSASLGMAMFPRDGDDAVRLLAVADAAMYEVKRSHRPARSLHSPPQAREEAAAAAAASSSEPAQPDPCETLAERP